jgi:hypothetical protein
MSRWGVQHHDVLSKAKDDEDVLGCWTMYVVVVDDEREFCDVVFGW